MYSFHLIVHIIPLVALVLGGSAIASRKSSWPAAIISPDGWHTLARARNHAEGVTAHSVLMTKLDQNRKQLQLGARPLSNNEVAFELNLDVFI